MFPVMQSGKIYGFQWDCRQFPEADPSSNRVLKEHLFCFCNQTNNKRFIFLFFLGNDKKFGRQSLQCVWKEHEQIINKKTL